MQALLADVPLASLQLLRKVTDKAIEGGENNKFRTLKQSNETVRTKLIDVPEVIEVMKVMGWTQTSEGLVCDESAVKKMEAGLARIDTAIGERTTAAEKEYEDRRAYAAAKAAELHRRQILDQQQQEIELKKIKAIQGDVRDRVIKASHADPTMGRSAAAEGIFAGAGGKSSSAKTFKDLGVSLQ